MSHMTKEHKAFLLEQYTAEQEALERAEYFPKLMQVLEAACAMGYKLTVHDKEFLLWEYDWTPSIWLRAKYTRENLEKLEEFDRELKMKQKARAEEVWRARVQKALAKLMEEERENLGLR